MGAPATRERTASRARLLLVDDDDAVLRALRRVLRRGDWDLETAPTAEAALQLLPEWRPEVVIADYRMPGMNGVELLSRVKELSPRTQRVLLTGQADPRAIEEAINRSQIFRFVSKPWNDAELLAVVRNAIEAHGLASENERLFELTQRQNQELRTLNAELEDRVARRTVLLSRAKRDWELTFDTIVEPLAVVQTNDHQIRRANRSYAAAAGRPVSELAAGQACHRFLFARETPCEGCPISAGLKPGSENRAEIRHADRIFELSVYKMEEEPVAVCNYREVTGERELTRRMIESDKMAAVGSLAGGVAHELNNPLGGILAFAQLMKRDKGRAPADLEPLELIEQSALRCKRIVESLLKYSRGPKEGERKPFDLSKCAEDASVLFRAQLKSLPKAEFTLALAPDLPAVDGDGGQLGQVVLNLLQNAAQALVGGEGRVRLETAQVDGRVQVTVSDTGCGIPAGHLARIFEPHFTTKAPGAGTGMGLAIAYRIVQDHGGHFAVRSEPGQGSEFTVSFPASSSPGR